MTNCLSLEDEELTNSEATGEENLVHRKDHSIVEGASENVRDGHMVVQ